MINLKKKTECVKGRLKKNAVLTLPLGGRPVKVGITLGSKLLPGIVATWVHLNFFSLK